MPLESDPTAISNTQKIHNKSHRIGPEGQGRWRNGIPNENSTPSDDASLAAAGPQVGSIHAEDVHRESPGPGISLPASTPKATGFGSGSRPERTLAVRVEVVVVEGNEGRWLAARQATVIRHVLAWFAANPPRPGSGDRPVQDKT
jgi:hypothetical protein